MGSIFIKGLKVLVSDEDIPRIQKYTWRVFRPKAYPWLIYFRAYDGGSHKTRQEMFLHRFLMGCKKGDGLVVDHINGNTLDCTRENLRIVSVAQNTQNSRIKSANTSGYKNVSYNTKHGKWKVDVASNGVSHFGGYFSDINKAAEKAAELRKIYQGEFATNMTTKQMEDDDE